jgi:aconitate hydratase
MGYQDTVKSLELKHTQGSYYSLPELGRILGADVNRLPHSIRIVLESVLRNCDGKRITKEHVQQVANWQSNAKRSEEIPFVVARVVLQDFKKTITALSSSNRWSQSILWSTTR